MRLLKLCLLLMLSGCYKTRIYSGSIVDEVSRSDTSTHTYIQNTFIFGMITPRAIDIDQVCGAGKLVALRSQVGLLAGLGSALTARIWVPMTVTITCQHSDARGQLDDGEEDEIFPALLD
ncbi:MAG: hypothetical protein ACI8S6_001387 [Myxococcota bacterium]|jgi:hypothetical protein